MSDTTNLGSAGSRITLPEARAMVEAYSAACSDTDIRSLTISAKFLRNIIDQPDCQYVRFYLAVEDPSTQAQGLPAGHTLVIIGADSTSTNIKLGDDNTEVYEQLTPCPPNCPGTDGEEL